VIGNGGKIGLIGNGDQASAENLIRVTAQSIALQS
jgi:hypothetical protein